MALLLGIGLFVLLWAVGPSKVYQILFDRSPRFIAGAAALIIAVLLLTRGAIELALPVGLVALGLLGWDSRPALFGGSARAGEVSRVRTNFLAMELDSRSGKMRGRIIAGRHTGDALDGLDVPTLVGLFAEIDRDSRDLLAAYLDRRSPGWRENAQDNAAAGGGPRPARAGKMTEEEAYQVLGIQPGASTQDVARAHRSLIKKLHPDQGGSTYLAARVNEAKDVLLNRHR